MCNFHVYIYILKIKTICGSKIYYICNYFNLFIYSLFIFLCIISSFKFQAYYCHIHDYTEIV